MKQNKIKRREEVTKKEWWLAAIASMKRAEAKKKTKPNKRESYQERAAVGGNS